MSLTLILNIVIFNCWEINFMGPFPSSGEYLYILIAIDYVFEQVEAIACKTND